VLRSSGLPYRLQDFAFARVEALRLKITCVFPLVSESAINIKIMQNISQ
jgi:hypothetical protein